MKVDARVFCDFENGDSNFYLYFGNLRNVKKVIDGN